MKDILIAGLPQLGADAALAEKLESFSRFLLERNKVMNLTAITQPADVAVLHLLDSLCLLPAADWIGKSVVDVGTGAGFPGIPLAIALPDTKFTLLDSLGKRVDFLQEACQRLELTNVSCIHGRAEDFAQQQRESFDLAVSRAVAGLPVLCELCLPLVKQGGQFLAMKSSHTEEEIASSEAAIRLLGGTLRSVADYTLPTTQVSHRLVFVEKLAPTPKKYPRRFAQIKKQPLGMPPSK